MATCNNVLPHVSRGPFITLKESKTAQSHLVSLFFFSVSLAMPLAAAAAAAAAVLATGLLLLLLSLLREEGVYGPIAQSPRR